MTLRPTQLAALIGAALLLGCTGASSAPQGDSAQAEPLESTEGAHAPAHSQPEATAAQQAIPAPGQALRVLFVGNSYTFSHDLPGLVEQIAEASQAPRPLLTHTVAFPGYSLEQHWERGDALSAIQKEAWDFVVLQDHSLQSVAAPQALFQASQSFGQAIEATGAQALFFVTWARRDLPSMQDGITLAYARAATQAKGRLVPVGPAWERARKDLPKLALYDDDGSHPSPAGTYLAACVFYSTFFARRAGGAEKLAFGELSETELSRLQDTAWTVVGSRSAAEGPQGEASEP